MYTFNSRVRYSEVNSHLTLDVGSIINYFQDCSTFQSEDLGVGIDHLKSRNRAWLMNAWQIRIFDAPKLGDPITIGTWAYDFKTMYGYRNFMIQKVDGAPAAVANSIWVYVDTATGRPAKITPEEIGAYPTEPPYPMEYAPRKIALPQDLTAEEPFPVPRSSLDSNHHVNNGQYIKMALNYLPEDFPVQELRAEYRKAAILGDTFHPLISKEENKITVVLADTSGTPYCITEFKSILS